MSEHPPGDVSEASGEAGAVPMSRRTFLWLGSLSGVSVLVPGPLSPPQADVQRTLEAVIQVLLPGGGAHGTEADEPGALDSQLYGQPIWAHLRGHYFITATDQAALEQAVRDLDRGARCLNALVRSFADLAETHQLGLLAFVTRREDEGEAPHLSPAEKACLRLAGAEGRAPEALDLMRLAGLIYYTSDPGLAWLEQFGYPGPNWGFNPASGWTSIEPLPS